MSATVVHFYSMQFPKKCKQEKVLVELLVKIVESFVSLTCNRCVYDGLLTWPFT